MFWLEFRQIKMIYSDRSDLWPVKLDPKISFYVKKFDNILLGKSEIIVPWIASVHFFAIN